jgi:hypothetical protein
VPSTPSTGSPGGQAAPCFSTAPARWDWCSNSSCVTPARVGWTLWTATRTGSLGLAYQNTASQVHPAAQLGQNKHKPPLFHFLDDNAKPWSKRCDFVIFYVNGRAFHADCIEFKSKSLTSEKIVPQLRAGMCWVTSLKRTIDQYTGDTRKIRLRKFVFAENENPGAYLDANRQLNADPSIRYYHFDEVNGLSLAALHNTSVQEI